MESDDSDMTCPHTRNKIQRFLSCRVRYPKFVRSSLSVYWIAALLRVVLTLIPQQGYIHPDEFFQSVEIVTGDILNVENSRPWEFKVSYPVRSISSIYLVLGPPLYLLKTIAELCGFNITSPYLLLVLPRLMFCLLSFVTDFSLYRICNLEGQDFKVRLLVLSTSHVILTYGTRTFSNSIEMALVSYLIYYVVSCMKLTEQTISTWEQLNTKFKKIENLREKIQLARQMKRLPSYQYHGALVIASILVLGTFNRPTFLSFAVPSVFYWLYRGIGTKHVTLYHFHMRLLCLVAFVVPLAMLCILADSFYFGKLTLEQILENNIYLSYSFVVAPYNFLTYNLDSKNLAKHGLHPRFTHVLVNLPLLYNVLAVIGFIAMYELAVRVIRKQWSTLPRIDSIFFLMILSLLCPVLSLSIFPHQEPRFLIPITLPMVYLFSHSIYSSAWGMQEQKDGSYQLSENTRSGAKVPVSGQLIRLWFLANMVLTFFFGFTHQAGVMSLVKHFAKEVHSKPPGTDVHLVTSYTYSMPLSLLAIPDYKTTLYLNEQGKRYRKSQDFFTYEMGSVTMRHLCKKLSAVQNESEIKKAAKKIQYRLYVALPASHFPEFRTRAADKQLDYEIEDTIFPHVTLEALPRMSTDGKCPYASVWMAPVHMFGSLVDQFKLMLIRIKPRPRVAKKIDSQNQEDTYKIS